MGGITVIDALAEVLAEQGVPQVPEAGERGTRDTGVEARKGTLEATRGAGWPIATGLGNS